MGPGGHLLRAYTYIVDGYGALHGIDNILQGKGTALDALAIAPMAGLLGGKLVNLMKGWKCFVGETQVVVGNAENEQVVGAESPMSSITYAWLAAGVALAGTGIGLTVHARKRRQKEKKRRLLEAIDHLFGNLIRDDLIGPAEIDSVNLRHGNAILSAVDSLFAGNAMCPSH